MLWTRKTEAGQYKPYISEDGRFTVADLAFNASLVPEYQELKKNVWASKEDHEKFLTYCKANKLNMNGANWVVVDNETKEVRFPFKTAKAAKEFAETK